MDLSTLRAEWESRSAAASSGSALNGHLSGSFGHLGSLNDGSSVSGSGNDVNEEIDVVGGLDSGSESESERIDSAADGSVDGECYSRIINEQNDNIRTSSSSDKKNPNNSLNINLDLNHQHGIRHWGLSLLERRRELVNLSNNVLGRVNSESSRCMVRSSFDRNNDDDVQSGSIDLSVKGRDERRRLNPFSIDSLLGNHNNNNINNRSSTIIYEQNRSSTPSTLTRQSSSPTSPISVPTSPSTT